MATRESAAPFPGRIFVSYRREDTAYPAGWLVDRLTEHFGTGQVFKDVDSIELGDDFVEAISAAVGSCHVLLALIGDEWLVVTGEDGRRRLDDPEDFVRVEIEAALRRDVRVIPILVDGARMPRVTELPPSLAGLVRRQALELSPNRFDYDTSRLAKVLDATLGEMHAEQAAPTTTPSEATRPLRPQPTAPPDRRPRPAPPPRTTGETPPPGEPVPRRQGVDVRKVLRWVVFGCLVLVVLVLLASRSEGMPALGEARPLQPQGDAWLFVLWMAPAVPLTVAAWHLAWNRVRGSTLGCVVAAAVWVALSWAVMERWDVSGPAEALHLLLLVLLVAAAVGIVWVTEAARERVQPNSGARASVAIVLVGAAAVLRLEAAPLAVVLDATEDTLDWVPKSDHGVFWVGQVLPILVAVVAASVSCNDFQSRALRTFIGLQVVYDLVLQATAVLQDVAEEPVEPKFLYQALVYMLGTLCLLWSVRVGQPRSRLRHRTG